MSQEITPIINPFYPESLNAVLLQGNTNLIVIKESPLDNPDQPNTLLNMMTLAVQHGTNEGSNDAIVAVKEVFTKDSDGNKILISTSSVIGSTTHYYGVEVFSDGRIFVKAKQYSTIGDAQNDQSLQVGESYMCNGFHMYKQ